jgi:UDP-N-acetylglucosamine 2-epimerase
MDGKRETVLSIVGARPQFIKAAVVSRAFAEAGVAEILVHTGQHYDYGMSEVFFRELEIPEPARNLGIGSGPHGRQTGLMLQAIETAILEFEPALVVIYGDTNSTLAAALAASKLRVPIAHVEAGLRSFNMRMPEEVNRVLSDRVSTLFFCPTPTAVRNLKREGISEGVREVGDVMYDAALFYAGRAPQIERTCAARFKEKGFYLATLHRAENTDDPARLEAIFTALDILDKPVVLPLHPRTKRRLAELGFIPQGSLRLVEPVGYLEMVALERAAAVILTDSGGMQKEACFHGTPCVTLREETEWVETVEAGWNILAGADAVTISAAVMFFKRHAPKGAIDAFGDGTAGAKIAETVKRFVGSRAGRR